MDKQLKQLKVIQINRNYLKYKPLAIEDII